MLISVHMCGQSEATAGFQKLVPSSSHVGPGDQRGHQTWEQAPLPQHIFSKSCDHMMLLAWTSYTYTHGALTCMQAKDSHT